MSLLIRSDNNLASLSNAPSNAAYPDGSAAFPIGVAQAPYPVGATPLAFTFTTNTATLMTAQFVGASGRTVYMTGFQITGTGATATSVIVVSTTNFIATQNWYLVIPAGVALPVVPGGIFAVSFNPPLPANALGVWPQVNVPGFGAGNTSAAINIQGYMI